MLIPLGARLGAYEIISSLGAGGMGEVYRARDTKLERDVAIKVLQGALAKDAEGLERFTREAHAVAALNHPNIVTIHSIEEADGVRFITMELVEGRTLDRVIPPSGLSVAQLFAIAIALADALSAAHRKQITHRDFKPANVMVSDDGHVKVLDFGLARSGEPRSEPGDETHAALTKAGTVLGTMPYMSPEQIEAKPLDHRTDIFSLGIVLYEMATGRRPFAGNTSPALMSSILKDHPTPVVDVRPDMPGSVSRLIDRCLEKDPRDRIQVASEILAEFRAQCRAWESGPTVRPAAPDSTPRPLERAASIAVLPFTDMSAAKDQDWFCDGIAEEILNALAPLKGLRVAARTSSFSFKGKSDDLRSIGGKLNVTTVLEGSVRRAGDRVRITVRLSDVQDGFQLWSERYDRELKDIFDVQDEIAKAIAERLSVTLVCGAGARLVAKATLNVEAYQLYLKGRALLYRRGESIPLALEQFQRAVGLDPDYGLAWAGIADVYTVLGYHGVAAPHTVRPRALEAAKKAIEFDPGSAEAHTARAMALLLWEVDPENAEREFLRAIELNPQYVQGRCWYALFYLASTRGRFNEGLVEVRLALESDPLSSYVMGMLAACLGFMGRGDEAIATARRSIKADPESFFACFILGTCLEWAGRPEEAVVVLQEACRISSQSTMAVSFLAAALASANRVGEARAAYHGLVARAASEYVAPSLLAPAAAAVGEREQALMLIKRAWAERDPFFLWAARFNPTYRWFHNQPEFAQILREMDDARREG